MWRSQLIPSVLGSDRSAASGPLSAAAPGGRAPPRPEVSPTVSAPAPSSRTVRSAVDRDIPVEAPADAEALRARLAEVVVLPGELGWDTARAAWNLAVDQQPALVVEPGCAADVQAVIDHARTTGLRVAMQGTGHNAAPLGPLADTVLVKTHRMRGCWPSRW